MGDQKTELYFVFMNVDPEYERHHADRWVSTLDTAPKSFTFLSKAGMEKLDAYLSNKHDQLLAKLLQPNTYRKKSSLAIVDGFSVEITEEQAAIIRLDKHVRVVEKNQELN